MGAAPPRLDALVVLRRPKTPHSCGATARARALAGLHGALKPVALELAQHHPGQRTSDSARSWPMSKPAPAASSV